MAVLVVTDGLAGGDTGGAEVNMLRTRNQAFSTLALHTRNITINHTTCVSQGAPALQRGLCVSPCEADFRLSSVIRISLNHGKIIDTTMPSGTPSTAFTIPLRRMGTLIKYDQANVLLNCTPAAISSWLVREKDDTSSTASDTSSASG